MGQLRKKLMNRLRHRFPPPARVSLTEDDGITGVVVSSEFQGQDDLDRINQVWEIIDDLLSPHERREIAMIEAVTPEEEAARSDGSIMHESIN